MANLKISALTPAAALVGDEVLPLVQDAGNVSATLNQVLALGGDLVGPAASTDNALARFDGTTGKLLQDSSTATLSDTGALTLSDSLTLTDATLNRDAAHVLAQRNGTNAQAFRLYNTYTDASNYERGFLQFTSNYLELGAEAAGTGTARVLHLKGAASHSVGLLTTVGGIFGSYNKDVRHVIDLSFAHGCLISSHSTHGSAVLFGAGANTSSTSACTNAVTFGPHAATYNQLTHLLRPSAKDLAGAYTGAGHHLAVGAGKGAATNNDGGNLYLRGGEKAGTGAHGNLYFADSLTTGISYFNVTPVAQQSGTGEATGFTAGAGTAVTDQSTFTGNVGSTAYRINDLIKALKNYGLLAA